MPNYIIVLHTVKQNGFSNRLEERLDELVIAYEKEKHEEDEIKQPFIEEGDNIYQTKEEIEEWLTKLKRELKWQRSLSGDGCYIDPDTGQIC